MTQHSDPTAPAATEAARRARLTEVQWHGWYQYQGAQRIGEFAEDDELYDAYCRGQQGIRPDTDALAAAEQAGYERGRDAVLALLRTHHGPHLHHASSPMDSDETCYAAILRECGAEEAGVSSAREPTVTLQGRIVATAPEPYLALPDEASEDAGGE